MTQCTDATTTTPPDEQVVGVDEKNRENADFFPETPKKNVSYCNERPQWVSDIDVWGGNPSVIDTEYGVGFLPRRGSKSRLAVERHRRRTGAERYYWQDKPKPKTEPLNTVQRDALDFVARQYLWPRFQSIRANGYASPFDKLRTDWQCRPRPEDAFRTVGPGEAELAAVRALEDRPCWLAYRAQGRHVYGSPWLQPTDLSQEVAAKVIRRTVRDLRRGVSLFNDVQHWPVFLLEQLRGVAHDIRAKELDRATRSGDAALYYIRLELDALLRLGFKERPRRQPTPGRPMYNKKSEALGWFLWWQDGDYWRRPRPEPQEYKADLSGRVFRDKVWSQSAAHNKHEAYRIALRKAPAPPQLRVYRRDGSRKDHYRAMPIWILWRGRYYIENSTESVLKIVNPSPRPKRRAGSFARAIIAGREPMVAMPWVRNLWQRQPYHKTLGCAPAYAPRRRQVRILTTNTKGAFTEEAVMQKRKHDFTLAGKSKWSRGEAFHQDVNGQGHPIKRCHCGAALYLGKTPTCPHGCTMRNVG